MSKKKFTTDQVIERFKEIHKDRYDYSKFVYSKARTKSIVICRLHGEFSIRPNDHLNGVNCATCAFGERNFNKNQKEKSVFLEDGTSLYEQRYKKIHETRKKNSNYSTARKKGIKKLKETIDEFGVSDFEKSMKKGYKTKVEMGFYNKKDDFQKYRSYKRSVIRETLRSLKKHPNIIDLSFSRKKFELDHKLSIFDGFKSQTPSNVVGHIMNLEVLTATANRSKNKTSSISLSDLMLLIQNFQPEQMHLV